MEKHKIKTVTACYTGGGIYIYYGQLENGLYFRTSDEDEAIYICNANTSTEEADYLEFYEEHTVEELKGKTFITFFNSMIAHVLGGGATFDKWSNYSESELERRIKKNK